MFLSLATILILWRVMDLKKLYCALIRSVIEYSSVVYHSQISKYQSNRLEKVQKKCLKIMFGYGKSYRSLLEKSGLETLESRRTRQFTKFAEKMAENKNCRHYFTMSERRNIQTRHQKKYIEFFARTDRLYRSPLYKMRRILNQTPDSDRFNNPESIDLSHLFNDPF